jgi:hypothetical protein
VSRAHRAQEHRPDARKHVLPETGIVSPLEEDEAPFNSSDEF